MRKHIETQEMRSAIRPMAICSIDKNLKKETLKTDETLS
jgi:hypothetical protein